LAFLFSLFSFGFLFFGFQEGTMSVMQLSAILIITISSFALGIFTLLGYMIKRMMSNDGWDDSNITNALRLLSHVTLHPEDFRRMYYLTDEHRKQLMLTQAYQDKPLRRPFHYVDKDELSEVVDTRP